MPAVTRVGFSVPTVETSTPPRGGSPAPSDEEVSEDQCCAICLDVLCDADNAPVCVLTKGGKRVCRHFFHLLCAQRIKSVSGRGFGEDVDTFFVSSQTKHCPQCRCKFDGVQEIPDPSVSPKKWFSIANYASNGQLSKDEVQEIFLSTLDLGSSAHTLIDTFWERWDSQGRGYLTLNDVGLLLPFIRHYLPGRSRRRPPFLPDDQGAWFDYFDEECIGVLSKEQIAKAIALTFLPHDTNDVAEEAEELLDSLWCLFAADETATTITRADFLKPRGLADTLCASLAEDQGMRRRVATALFSPKNSPTRKGYLASLIDDNMTVGSSVRVKSDIGTPRFKWGYVRPGDVGTVVSIDDNGCCKVDFPKQEGWRAHVAELEVVNVNDNDNRQWCLGDTVRIIANLARARAQQETRSNWIPAMDRTCGQVGKVVAVMANCRKLKVKINRTTFVYVVENCVRPHCPDPPEIAAGMRVRVRPDVTNPKFQWGNVRHDDIGVVTQVFTNMTCQVAFARQSEWRGYIPELEIVSDATPDGEIGIGSRVRVKEEVENPKFEWGRVKRGEVGIVKLVDEEKGVCMVDFPNHPGWYGCIIEMELAPATEWSCSACTFLNVPSSPACAMCNGLPTPTGSSSTSASGSSSDDISA